MIDFECVISNAIFLQAARLYALGTIQSGPAGHAFANERALLLQVLAYAVLARLAFAIVLVQLASIATVAWRALAAQAACGRVVTARAAVLALAFGAYFGSQFTLVYSRFGRQPTQKII